MQVDQPDEVSEFDAAGANTGGNWNWNQGIGDLFDFVPNLIGSIKGTQPDQVTNVYAPTPTIEREAETQGWSNYAIYGIIAL